MGNETLEEGWQSRVEREQLKEQVRLKVQEFGSIGTGELGR